MVCTLRRGNFRADCCIHSVQKYPHKRQCLGLFLHGISAPFSGEISLLIVADISAQNIRCQYFAIHGLLVVCGNFSKKYPHLMQRENLSTDCCRHSVQKFHRRLGPCTGMMNLQRQFPHTGCTVISPLRTVMASYLSPQNANKINIGSYIIFSMYLNNRKSLKIQKNTLHFPNPLSVPK